MAQRLTAMTVKRMLPSPRHISPAGRKVTKERQSTTNYHKLQRFTSQLQLIKQQDIPCKRGWRLYRPISRRNQLSKLQDHFGGTFQAETLQTDSEYSAS